MTVGRAESGKQAINVHVGAQICRCRDAIGLSQEQVAEALGISAGQLDAYEHGFQRLGASQAVRHHPGAAGSHHRCLRRPRRPGGPGDGPPDAETSGLIAAFARIPDGGVRRNLLDLVRTLGANTAN